MSVLLALVAQCLHIVLLVLAAPTAMGVLAWAEARLAGRPGPSWRAPWQDLARLRRKQMVLAESASPLFTAAPLVCFAALAVAAALVPSFTLGMMFAPLADLLVIGGLLALARVTLALAALDEGTAAGGVAARQGMTLAVCARTGTAAGRAGPGAGGGHHQRGSDRRAAAGAGWCSRCPASCSPRAALALLAVVQRDAGMPEAAAFSASGLALLRMAEALRLLVWIDLLGALFVPVGMASAQDFPAGWVRRAGRLGGPAGGGDRPAGRAAGRRPAGWHGDACRPCCWCRCCWRSWPACWC